MGRYIRKTKEITLQDAIVAAKNYQGSRSEFSKEHSACYRRLLEHDLADQYLPRKIKRKDVLRISMVDQKPQLPQRWFPLESDISRPK